MVKTLMYKGRSYTKDDIKEVDTTFVSYIPDEPYKYLYTVKYPSGSRLRYFYVKCEEPVTVLVNTRKYINYFNEK